MVSHGVLSCEHASDALDTARREVDERSELCGELDERRRLCGEVDERCEPCGEVDERSERTFGEVHTPTTLKPSLHFVLAHLSTSAELLVLQTVHCHSRAAPRTVLYWLTISGFSLRFSLLC